MPFGPTIAPLLTSLALQVALLLVAGCAACWVVRRAVAHGIRDARLAERAVLPAER